MQCIDLNGWRPRNIIPIVAIWALLILFCAHAYASPESETLSCEKTTIEQRDKIRNLAGELVSVDAIDDFLEQRMAKKSIPGVSLAIMNDGQIVLHRTVGVSNGKTGDPITNCTIFQGASITKPLFSHFVMTFVEDGSLDLDRPLYEYLPYAPIAHDERYKLITARMALTHRTGFPNWRDDAPKLHLKFTPGTKDSYSGEGYEYLAHVLKEIAGVDNQGLENIFQERIAHPLGLNNTEIVPWVASDHVLARTARPHVDGQLAEVTTSGNNGAFGAAYGVHSEAVDYANWMIALMKGKVLSEVSMEEFFRPQGAPKSAFKRWLARRGLGHNARSLGFVIRETPYGIVYGHDGNNPGYSSMIALQRDTQWGIAVLTNAHQESDFGLDIVKFLSQAGS